MDFNKQKTAELFQSTRRFDVVSVFPAVSTGRFSFDAPSPLVV